MTSDEDMDIVIANCPHAISGKLVKTIWKRTSTDERRTYVLGFVTKLD